MANNTSRLDLLKKNPVTDGADTFNIETMLNENWDKLDKMVALIDPVTGKLLPGQENPVDVTAIEQQLTDIENSIGNLPSLETDVKSSLVAAINEVKRAVAAHLADIASDEVGKGADLIGLPDTDNNFTATTVSGGMQELFTNVSNGKSLIGGAITDVDDNVIIPPEPSFNDLATAIGGISTGKKWASGTITSGNIQAPITAINGTNTDSPYVDFRFGDLPFTPERVIFLRESGFDTYITVWNNYDYYQNGSASYGNCLRGTGVFRVPYSDVGVTKIPVTIVRQEFTWIAYE